MASAPPVAECRKSVFAELGLGVDAILGLGMDRLDYTKGIEERLLAVERMLERYPAYRGRLSFVHHQARPETAVIIRDSRRTSWSWVVAGGTSGRSHRACVVKGSLVGVRGSKP